MDINFIVKGSEGRTYQIEFKRREQGVTATCRCKAGIMGNFCKHRIAILAGDFAGLLNKEDETRARQILDWPEIKKVMQEAEHLLRIQAEIEKLKKEEAKIKKVLSQTCAVQS